MLINISQVCTYFRQSTTTKDPTKKTKEKINNKDTVHCLPQQLMVENPPDVRFLQPINSDNKLVYTSKRYHTLNNPLYQQKFDTGQ